MRTPNVIYFNNMFSEQNITCYGKPTVQVTKAGARVITDGCCDFTVSLKLYLTYINHMI